jgi:hypothetical protein
MPASPAVDPAGRRVARRPHRGTHPLTPGGGVRDLGTALLVRLIRSRQASADLVYEAYQSDLGGEA